MGMTTATALLCCAAFLLALSAAASRLPPSPPHAAAAPPSNPGPIHGSGSNYTKVCDAARFADLGLDMARFQYCNASLPYPARARDLIGRLTLAEKVANIGDKAQGAIRVGLPPYNYWSEALHGISDVGHGCVFGGAVPAATSFPTPILTAAAFDEPLWKRIGETISTEGRAMYNLGQGGLTYWSPNINPVRDPRWGRALETPGEDPFTVGRYAVNFVRGMQDLPSGHGRGDSRPIKVSACCKHYAAYDVDDWMGVRRYEFDARVRQQDMAETFVRPFEMCVREGDASAVMCSYNRVNGIPMCADAELMSQRIRGKWGLHGYIVSDCDSVAVMTENAKWQGFSAEENVAQTLRAGLDLDCGLGDVNYFVNYTMSAVRLGKVRESHIDGALHNLYMLLFRVGFFDGIPELESLGAKDVCSDEHKELAAQVAREGAVLLKNEGRSLPLDPAEFPTVALVGPHANATTVMIGNYNGKPCRFVSPLDTFSEHAAVQYSPGCVDGVKCARNDTAFGEAVAAAKNATATVIFAGLDLSVEAESNDREDLLLPGSQTDLINMVASASEGPVILVLMSGGGIDITFAEKNPKIGAILWAGYPGGEGGRAVADVVFGKYNPGGRLPITWHKNSYVQQLPLTSMQLRPVPELGYPGRTYKFYDGEVLYPFGHGLSYTTFAYGKLAAVSATVAGHPDHCKILSLKHGLKESAGCNALHVEDIPCRETISFSVAVSNTGKKSGSHVVMVYSKPPEEVRDQPAKQLVGFRRVFVKAGAKKTVKFRLNACKALGLVEKTAYSVIPRGTSTIVVGDGDAAVSFPVQINFSF